VSKFISAIVISNFSNMPTRLSPIMIFVKDFDKCLQFYENVFGLSPSKLYTGKEHPAYVEFRVDNETYLALHADYDGTPHKQCTPIALHFQVSDIRSTIQKVKEHGGEVIQELRKLDFRDFAEMQIVEDARVIDPDGNELELRQVLETTRN
jgi:predicted enzyme related to lactoylglutathione lyase